MPVTSWTRPFTRWFGRAAAPEGAAAPGTAPATEEPTAVPAPQQQRQPPATEATDVAALHPFFMHWLLDLPSSEKPLRTLPSDAHTRSLPGSIDAVTLSDAQCASLLPRAAQVVPQLMKAMRDERYSAADVASRIAKDVVLTTEIIRLANSVHRAGKEPIVEVSHAVTAIGSDGLRRAIAKVVLRPVFEARTAPLSINAAPHIWVDADRKARLGAALAPFHGVDPLDGYLAGLLHNTGWTALLRVLDSLRPPPVGAVLLDADLGRELVQRRDRLFGRLVFPWDVSPALTSLASEVREAGLAAVRSPLADVLRTAEDLATRHALQRSHVLPGGVDALAADQPDAVRDCLETLDRP